jgi:hypothetical protein
MKAKTIFEETYNLNDAIETMAMLASGHEHFEEHAPCSRGFTGNPLILHALYACGEIEFNGENREYTVDYDARGKADRAYRILGCKFAKAPLTLSGRHRVKMSTIIKAFGGKPELRTDKD